MLKEELEEVGRMLEGEEEMKLKERKVWKEPQLIKSDEPLDKMTMRFYPPPR